MRTLKFVVACLSIVAVAPASGGEFHVCINPDRTLRQVGDHAACRPGEGRVILEQQTPGKTEIEGEDAKVTALEIEVQRLKKKLAEYEPLAEAVRLLSSRVDMLERTPVKHSQPPAGGAGVPHRVRAPFEVVGADGSVILRVASRVSSTKGQGARVTIGAGDHGNVSLRVFAPGGNLLAGIGESSVKMGVVAVLTPEGEVAASMNSLGRVSVFGAGEEVAAAMSVDNSSGRIAVYHEKVPVAYLQRSSGGDGGNVSAAMNDGTRIFAAGAAQDGAGEACLNRRGGNSAVRTVCLGIGMPGVAGQ
jgi:hypothetical protein